MPHPFPELALVAIDTRPHRHEGLARISAAAGPGWFDSSWDLGHGLVVREGLPSDAGLNEWLELWLRSSDDRVTPSDPYGIDGLELA